MSPLTVSIPTPFSNIPKLPPSVCRKKSAIAPLFLDCISLLSNITLKPEVAPICNACNVETRFASFVFSSTILADAPPVNTPTKASLTSLLIYLGSVCVVMSNEVK